MSRTNLKHYATTYIGIYKAFPYRISIQFMTNLTIAVVKYTQNKINYPSNLVLKCLLHSVFQENSLTLSSVLAMNSLS